MWIARDKDGELWFYTAKPHRRTEDNTWQYNGFGGFCIRVDINLFPELTWEDEPVEVNIVRASKIIKKKDVDS